MEKTVSASEREFRLGWFSVGDLISLAAALGFAGIMYQQGLQNTKDIELLRQEQQTQRQMLSDRVVLKDDYRDDILEIKQLLKDLNGKVDSKADKK